MIAEACSIAFFGTHASTCLFNQTCSSRRLFTISVFMEQSMSLYYNIVAEQSTRTFRQIQLQSKLAIER